MTTWREPTRIGECAVCGKVLYTATAVAPDFDALTNGLFVNDGGDLMESVCAPFHNELVAGELVPNGCLASFLNTHPEWEVGS